MTLKGRKLISNDTFLSIFVDVILFPTALPKIQLTRNTLLPRMRHT